MYIYIYMCNNAIITCISLSIYIYRERERHIHTYVHPFHAEVSQCRDRDRAAMFHHRSSTAKPAGGSAARRT